MITHRSVREGMTVFSSDGEKLGKVLSCDPSTFTIEKGFFFPKDYVARYDEVAAVSGDEIRLSTTKENFIRLRDMGVYGYRDAATSSRGESEGIRVPMAEEELDVVKRDREAGEVRLRKERITEQRAAEANVRRERVDVESEHARGVEGDFSRHTRRDPTGPYPSRMLHRDDEDLP